MIEVEVVQTTLLRLFVFPNPAEVEITVRYIATETQTQSTMKILNALGKEVYQSTIDLQPGRLEKQIQIDEWPAGVYYLQLSNERTKEVVKFKVL